MAERQRLAVGDMLPILVGVVGKRALEGEARGRFDARFGALLGYLDHVLPDTPKVLVCGGAAGADLAAARHVLGDAASETSARPGWSVALVLPFDDANFDADFDTEAFASDLTYLRHLRERAVGNTSLILKRMRPLHHNYFDDGRLEPEDAARFGDADLRKPAKREEHNETRSCHFEQLGLWLARYSTILIAVGPAEEACPGHPHRLGGTARVVAYRRTATPDEAAAYVIERSSELLSSSPFEEQDGGYVLWLDPTAREVPTAWGSVPGVRVLRPIQRVAEVADAAVEISGVRAGIYARPMHDPYDGAPEHRARCHGALTLATAIQRMHARRLGVRRWPWRRHGASAPLAGEEAPFVFLEQARKGTLDRQQLAAAAWTRRAQRACALLFFVALFCLEIFAELAEEEFPLLVGYIALLLAIFAVAMIVRSSKLQVRSEDYRGLKEMLRIQIAWWSAGIDRMVDRVHLRTIDTDLRLVREAAAAVTMWAVLRCTKLNTLNAADIWDPQGGLTRVKSWIDGQADFFAKRARPQYGAARLAEMAFGLTFLAAILVLSLRLLVEYAAPDIPARIVAFAPLALAALPPCGALLVVGMLQRINASWFGRDGFGFGTIALSALAVALVALVELQAARDWFGAALSLPRWMLCPHPWAVPLALGGVLAALAMVRVPDVTSFDVRPLQLRGWVTAISALVGTVLIASIAFAPMLSHLTPAMAMGKLVLVQAVLLLGGTGMVRWYSEHRNHLAQAAQYDDMLRAFRRAQDWLRHREDCALDRDARHKLIELGELALDENEAWLKAHRDRPTEPIAGA